MKIKFSHIIKFIFFIYVIVQFGISDIENYTIVMLLLLNAAICILKERFYFSRYANILEFIAISAASYVDNRFMFLYAITMYDFVYDEFYYEIILVIIGSVFFMKEANIQVIMFYLLAAMLAYCSKKDKKKEKGYRNTFDSERRLRYELESAKTKLLSSSKEVAHIAEIKERNRIARDIHDNIGHSIAGIYMQLQVVEKLYGKDDNKAKQILKSSVEGMSNTLTLLRETVHNIKPKENLGIGYITEIIENFKFCNIEFSHSGNVNSLLPEHIELIAVNLKEALTNASKYSKATNIKIDLDINEKYSRLYIKDNGIGSKRFKEGLGLSGMRERVKNFGGTLSISNEDGFLIVCIIPNDSRGGKLFENTNS